MNTIPTKEGRITLAEKTFKITKSQETYEIVVENDEYYFYLLKAYFEITLNEN